MVIVYKVDGFSAWLARRIINVLYIGLCNLIGPEPVCQEYVQEFFKAEHISKEIIKIISNDTYRSRLKDKLANIKPFIYRENGSKTAATAVLSLLEDKRISSYQDEATSSGS